MGESFQSHGADGDAVFGEAGANEGQQAQPLRVGRCTDGSGDEDVTASLPFFHGERGGDFGEQIAIRGQNARLAAADEAGEFGGAAMVEGIVRAEFADELADGGAARLREEITGGGSSVFRGPWAGAIGTLRGACSGQYCEPFAGFDFGASHGDVPQTRTV